MYCKVPCGFSCQRDPFQQDFSRWGDEPGSIACIIATTFFKTSRNDMTKIEALLKEALVLPVQEKSELIEQLIRSLDKPDPEIDELWKKEAESRIDAFDDGKLSSVTVQEAISKYKK
jgi:putative addiction module component (TIGR02574 family)